MCTVFLTISINRRTSTFMIKRYKTNSDHKNEERIRVKEQLINNMRPEQCTDFNV